METQEGRAPLICEPRSAEPRYRYAMISNEVRRDLQAPLSWFTKLEVFHFYRVAPWNDMKPEDFVNKQLIRFVLPFDLFFKLWQVRPEIVQGPEPLSILMLPYLVMTLLYLWLHPKVRLVTLSLEPIPLGKKYHPVIVPIYRAILWLWFRRASVIFWFDSGSHRNLLVNCAPPEKLVNLIYGSWGIDSNEFTPEGPAIRIPTDKPVILYVGRLSPVKGVTYLLDAFKLLLDRGIKVHLAIVGDGSERAALEAKAANLDLGDHITWYGTIKNADLPSYMRAAELLVLPSITTKLWVQQLSITAWQAMGCGLPVISTQTGCMEEFTPHEVGILVPERDSRALADAVSELLTDQPRHLRMAHAARSYALQRFDARHNIRQAEETILAWCYPHDSSLTPLRRKSVNFNNYLHRLYRRIVPISKAMSLNPWISESVSSGIASVDVLLRRITHPNLPTSQQVNGFKISYPGDGYFPVEISSGEYEPKTTRVFASAIKPGMNVVDVGAHVGYYALVAARALEGRGRVFAFEPDPISFKYIQRNATHNGYATTIEVQPYAVGEVVGSAQLYAGRRDRVENSIFKTPNTSARSVSCQLMTLDRFFEQLNWPPVGLVKMDVEGAEHAVLKGMSQLSQRNPQMKLILEILPRNLVAAGVNLEELFATIQGLGFSRTSMILQELVPLALPADIPLLVEKCGRSFINVLCEKE